MVISRLQTHRGMYVSGRDRISHRRTRVGEPTRWGAGVLARATTAGEENVTLEPPRDEVRHRREWVAA